MKKRRDYAWQIVKRIWTPVQVPGGGQIPIGMTWYEQEDIAELYNQMLSQPKPLTRLENLARVSDVMKRYAVKDLRASLTANLFAHE